MPHSTLDVLADLRTGYTLREKTDPGSVAIVQAADLADNRLADDLGTTTDARPGPEHRLRAGDVLVSSRGDRNAAAFVERDMPDVVAASYLYVIRVRPGAQLDPEFLAWYLTTDPAQDSLGALAHGTYGVRRVRIDDMRALPVPLPPLDVQQRIAQAARRARAEASLAARLAERRRALVDAFLLQTTLRHD